MLTRLRKKRSLDEDTPDQAHAASIATPLDDEKERTIDQLRKQLSKASEQVSCLHAAATVAYSTIKNLQEETITLKSTVNELESKTETAKHDRTSLAQEVSDLKTLNYRLRQLVAQQRESLSASSIAAAAMRFGEEDLKKSALSMTRTITKQENVIVELRQAAAVMRSGEEERTQLALESSIAESEAQDRVITELGQELTAQKRSDAANLFDLAEQYTTTTFGMKQQHDRLCQQFAAKEAAHADTMMRLDASVNTVAALQAKEADAETLAQNLAGERDVEWIKVLESNQRDSNANHTAQHQAHEVEKDNIKAHLKMKFETAYNKESDRAGTAIKKLEEIKRFVTKI